MRLTSPALLLVATVGFGCLPEGNCPQIDVPGAHLVERLDGVVSYTRSGTELPVFVSSVADVNGDGVGDLMISTTGDGSRRAYVVFGGAHLESAALDQAVADAHGFVIEGAPPSAAALGAAAPIGDVNGDGLADLALGGSMQPIANPGHGFIVFGRAAAAPVELATLVENGDGVVISSSDDSPSEVGRVMARAGDVDGDGIGDVFVLRSLGERSPDSVDGETYVPDAYELWLVPGGGPRTITLGVDMGPRVVLRDGGADGKNPLILGTGDLDGDGREDFAVGDPEAADLRGRLYVVSGIVFDSAGDSVRTPSDAVAAGLAVVLEGAQRDDQFGSPLVAVGDVNGDGLPDVAVGANRALSDDRGQVTVVYGGLDIWTVTRDRLEQGIGGVIISGENPNDYLGYVGGGDMDGDGVQDLLVGSIVAPAGASAAGVAHMLLGSFGWADRSVAPGSPGLVTIAGPPTCDSVGRSVVALGDVTDDGYDDFAMVSYSLALNMLDLADAHIHIVKGRSSW